MPIACWSSDWTQFAPASQPLDWILWWGHLVISHLSAEELLLLAFIRDSEGHTYREQASFLTNASLGLSLSLIAMLSQFNYEPFGIPLSLPEYRAFQEKPEEDSK
jgi:hypothetical protein